MSVIFSKCTDCKHLALHTIEDIGTPMTCDAYPEGIPDEAWWSDESTPCTELISFEPID